MTTNELTTHESLFEGRPITTIIYKGRPCWIARDVGQWLGYSSPGRFAQKMSGEWSDEFIPHEDYEVLRGSELKDFKAFLANTTETVVLATQGIVILFESGLDLALLKTNKPKGKQLRRLLKTEVLPQLRRAGGYSLTRTPESKAPQRIAPTDEPNDHRGRWLKWLYQELQGNLFANERTRASLAIQAAEAGSGYDLSHIEESLGRVPRGCVESFLANWYRPGGRTDASRVYGDYRAWLWFEGIDPLDDGWFKIYMRQLGFEIEHDEDGSYYPVTNKCL